MSLGVKNLSILGGSGHLTTKLLNKSTNNLLLRS